MAGMQQRRAMTDKEKRILAYHEGGHALVSHLMNTSSPVQKATIIARGDALGYTLHMPDEERYIATKEELVDWMVVTLAGRAAEQVIFGRVTTGAANDLEKVTSLARSMVFEYGMGESSPSRTMRADNYALSEEAKRQRDLEQTQLTEHAYAEALRLLVKHRALLDRVAHRAAGEGDAVAQGAARDLRRRRARVARVRDRRRRPRRRRRLSRRPAWRRLSRPSAARCRRRRLGASSV